MEVHRQKQEKNKLEHKLEELIALLAQMKSDRDRDWALSTQYRDTLIETANVGKFWKNQALEREAQIEDLKDKRARMVDELNRHIPNFIYAFEKAEEEIWANPMLHLPHGVEEFMKISRSLARGFKRKRTNLLM